MPNLTRYSLSIFKITNVEGEHLELGTYEYNHAPWVPRRGEFFRFRDPYPPNRPYDHTETAGRVQEVVTAFYGTHVHIEIYIQPRK